MGRRFRISYEERISAIEKYLRGEDTLNHLAKQLKVNKESIKQWLLKYQALGPAGLKDISKIRRTLQHRKKQP